jgi:hypothetical protein
VLSRIIKYKSASVNRKFFGPTEALSELSNRFSAGKNFPRVLNAEEVGELTVVVRIVNYAVGDLA